MECLMAAAEDPSEERLDRAVPQFSIALRAGRPDAVPSARQAAQRVAVRVI